jgi:hypothetical protein
MPQIIVQAAPGESPGAVTFRERVTGSDLNSDHFAGRLVERIGWALLDAEDIEASARHVRREEPADGDEADRDLARCDLPAHREPLYLD